jgi:MscS family membrane protein
MKPIIFYAKPGFIGLFFLLVLLFAFPVSVYCQQDTPTLVDVLGGSEEGESSEQAAGEPSDQEMVEPERGEVFAETPPAPADEFNRGTPRSTIKAYLETARSGDYLTALHYLDLRNLPTELVIHGERLARHLRIVLEKSLWVDFDEVSDHPEGNLQDGLSRNLEEIGRVEDKTLSYDIVLQRVPREDGVYIWKFSNQTVFRIPEMYKQFGYGPAGELLSPLFPSRQFLGIRLWQWFAIFAFGALSFLVSFLLTKLTVVLVRLKKRELNKQFIRFFSRPVRFFLFILLWGLSATQIDLSVSVRVILSSRPFLIFASIWIVIKLVDLIIMRTGNRMQERGQTSAPTLLRPLSNMFKAFVILIGLAIWLDALGVKVTTLFAGIGIGGAAIAFAAQDSLKNFFGGVTVLVDKPFYIGQRIVVNGNDGVVEEIGLRSTRIRLLTGHRVSVPNKYMSELMIENISERPHIRRLTNIRLALDTPPDKARRAVQIIEEVLDGHEGQDPDFPPRVYLNEFNEDSLNILVLYWYHPADYWSYNALNQRVNLSIMEAFEKEGIHLAPPTFATVRREPNNDTLRSDPGSELPPPQ